MENFVNKLIAIFLVVLFVIGISPACSSDSDAEQSTLDTVALNKKLALVPSSPLILNLCQYSVSTIIADTFYTAAVNGITYGSEPFTISGQTLSLTYLNQVNADMQSAAPQGPAGSGFTPGFVITPVLINTKEIIYLFQFCDFICDDPAIGMSETFSVVNLSPNYYSCTPEGTLVEYQHPLAAIKQYSNSVRFQISATQTRTFDPQSDTRQIYAPIQKMLAMINANAGQNGFKNAKGVKFLHYSNLVKDTLRQSVLFAPDNVTPQIIHKAKKNKNFVDLFLLVGSFGNAFANRSHLCPPSCNTLALTVSTATADNCQ